MQTQEAVKTPAPKIAVASRRPELEQAQLRVLIAAVILAYLLWYVLRDRSVGPEEYELLALTGGFLVFSALLTLWILAAPHVSVPRLFLGMVVDNAITTYCLIRMGEGSAVVLFVYLFITFGNGFRFGRVYLHACQVMALAGFTLVLLLSPFWSQHVMIGIGFILSLIILPFYVGQLAERIKAERAKAEEALKECIERERRGH